MSKPIMTFDDYGTIENCLYDTIATLLSLKGEFVHLPKDAYYVELNAFIDERIELTEGAIKTLHKYPQPEPGN